MSVSDAAYDRINSTAVGSGERSPRKVLMATGKNVRYAAMIETESHCGMSRRPPQTTTMGAMARIGTV